MAKTYYSVLTTYGSQLFANAMTNRQAVNITHFAVGDGNGRAVQPDSTRTSLVREVHKASISAVSRDPRNNRQVIFELTLPENVGGFWIREMGIFDNAGRLVAIANCPDTYKPRLEEGSGKIQVLRMILLVSSSDAVTLSVDDTVIFVTRGQFTPKTITATSINGFDDTGHSHAIDTATTSRKGITQLTNDTGLDSESLALTAKAGKAIAQSVAQLQLSTTNALNQKVNKTDISNAVNSTSQTTVASSQAVKTAYDLANSKYTAQDASPTQKGLVQLANNLTTDDATKALTAAQGKALEEKKENKLVETELDLRHLNHDHWYPVTFLYLEQTKRHQFIISKLWGDRPIWSTHVDGFTLYAEWSSNGSGWGARYVDREIHCFDYRFIADDKSPIINIGQIMQASIEYCYLRGGSRYKIFADSNIIVTLNDNGYRWQSEELLIITTYDASLIPKTTRQLIDDKKVNKSGDTMTGNLTLSTPQSLVTGVKSNIRSWAIGDRHLSGDDISWVSYKHGTEMQLETGRIRANKPLYHGTNQVFDEGNLLPVKHINLRSHIPNTQIEYQNATPAELPMGSYTGFTTNAQLSNGGVFSGFGFVTKIDNTQAFRQAVNFDRFFAQWGNTTNGWGGVHEYFMIRPQLWTSDLNNVTVCGVYSQTLNANAQPNLNYPTQEAGTLLVTPSAYGCQQEYTTFLTCKKFVRGRGDSGWLPWKRIDAIDCVMAGDVAVLTGEIAHGGTLPIPSGFTESQCRFFVSMKHSNPNGMGWDWNEHAGGRHYRTQCYASGRTVICQTFVSEGIWGHGAIPLTIDGIANYLVIGVK